MFKNPGNISLLVRKKLVSTVIYHTQGTTFYLLTHFDACEHKLFQSPKPTWVPFFLKGIQAYSMQILFSLALYCCFCKCIRLWQRVTRAINAKDQTEATQEKYVLEEAQRQAARDRKTKSEEWICKLFELDSLTGEWHYKFAE